MTNSKYIPQEDVIASARALIRQGKPREAFHAVIALKHLAEHDTSLLLGMSSLMTELREFGTAAELIQQALALSPDNLMAKFAMCETQSFYFRNEEVRSSILHRVNKIVSENAFPGSLWTRASETFERLRYPPGVVRAAQNAVIAAPNSLDTLRRLAYVYVFANDSVKALHTLRKLQTLESLSQANRAEFASLALRLGDTDLSLAFSNVVDRENVRVDLLVSVSRAEALLAAGRQTAAAELARFIALDISLFKGRPVAALKEAALLRKLGLFAIERDFLLKASATCPNDIDILEATRSATLLQPLPRNGRAPSLRDREAKGPLASILYACVHRLNLAKIPFLPKGRLW